MSERTLGKELLFEDSRICPIDISQELNSIKSIMKTWNTNIERLQNILEVTQQ